MDVLNLTGDMRLKFAFQESDDREVWPTTFGLFTGAGINVDGPSLTRCSMAARRGRRATCSTS